MEKLETKRFICGLIILVLSMVPVWFMYAGLQGKNTDEPVSQSSASDENIELFNADNWSVFSSRSIEEIVDKYNQMIHDVDEEDIYDKSDSVWGEMPEGLSQKTMDSVLDSINYFRFLEGVPELSVNSDDNMKLEAAAYINSLAEQMSSIWTTRPEKIPVELYRLGVNAKPAAVVKTDSVNTAVKDCLKGSLSEGELLAGRMALLSYKLKAASFGYYSGTFTCDSYGGAEDDMLYAFTAYPSPGVYPANDIDKDNSVWHIELNNRMIEYSDADDIQIDIADTDDILVYKRTVGDGLSIRGGLIAFSPPKEDGDMYSHEYVVKVSGLKTLSGRDAVIKYTVSFFDRNDYMYSEIASIEFDPVRIYLPKDASDENINEVLPKQVRVVLENGSAFDAEVINWAKSVSQSSGINDDTYIAVINPDTVSGYATDSKGLLQNIKLDIVRYENGARLDEKTDEDGRTVLYVESVFDDIAGVSWYYSDEDGLKFISDGGSIVFDTEDKDRVYEAFVKRKDTLWMVTKK